jgi:hypothetical protein
MDRSVELQPKAWISNGTGISPTISVRRLPLANGQNLDTAVTSGADENIEVFVIP